MRRCADGGAAAPVPERRARRSAACSAALAGILASLLIASSGWAGGARAAREPATPAAASVIERAGAAVREPGTVSGLDERAALQAGQAAIGRWVPDPVMLDRQGRQVRLSSYRGKPLLVSFIYTGCFRVCPTQTRALHEAVRGLDRMLGASQFNVVSIGFNQPFDDPQAMRAFAASQRIDEPNWEFLSPAREAVDDLTQAFGFRYAATPAGFDHVLGVTVVDARGRIHAQVYGDRIRADQLGKPLRELLLDAQPAAGSTLAAVIERVRMLCTVYDPDTGEYRYDYKLILELIGGVLFFGSVAIYLLLEWRGSRRARRLPCAASNTSDGMV
ncbi:MAG: SCO family protein [Burkholderiales bacterium]|nr:SCO family protein [Burkholderiales bacterium]